MNWIKKEEESNVKIQYRPHLLKRLIERKISINYPKKIYREADKMYFDTVTLRHIAVKKLLYKGKLRNIIVAYDIINEIIEMITIHPISDSELQNKMNTGRWTIYEKD